MQRKVKRSPMDRHHQLAFQGQMGVGCMIRTHVYIRPVFAVSPYFQHGEVEGPEGISYFLKSREPAGISTVENFMFWPFHNERGPKRCVAIKDTPPGKVPGRCSGEHNVAACHHTIAPVHL